MQADQKRKETGQMDPSFGGGPSENFRNLNAGFDNIGSDAQKIMTGNLDRKGVM
jgi:hypothetical protein